MGDLDNTFVDISKFQSEVIVGDEALANVCDAMLDRSVLSIDSETTGLDPKRSRLSLVQIADLAKQKAYVIDYFTIKNAAPLANLISQAKIDFLCHTGNFDCEFFIHNFNQYIETPIDVFQGGLLLRRYMDRPIADFSLKLMLERYCGIRISKEMQVSDWGRRPLFDEQIKYAILDATTLYPLAVAIGEEIDREGMWEAWAVESLLQMVTAQLRYNGIFVDAGELRPLGVEIKAKIKKASELISAYPELRSDVTNILTMLEGGYDTINLDSPVQLKKALEKRWGCEVPSTKASEIKKFWGRDPDLVELLAERASLKSMLANHVDGILDAIDSITGRVHSDFLQNASPQHRPKSSRPILLNIPKKSKYGPAVLNKESLAYSERNFRDCFKPAPGCVFVKSDYSGLQLRAIAQESGDPVMCLAFQNNEDLHALTASFIFDIPIEKVNQAQRDLGKTVNFAVSFMCSAQTLQRTFLKDLGVRKTEKECEMFIKRFLKRYRGVAAYHKYQPLRAKREGRIVVRGGRATLLKLGADPSTEAVNFVCALIEQSGIKKALARLGRIFWKLAKETGKICRIVLSVFDEILVECDASLAEQVKEILSREMVKAMMDYIWKIPVKADAKICSTWGGRAVGEVAVYSETGATISKEPFTLQEYKPETIEQPTIASVAELVNNAVKPKAMRKIVFRPGE